MPTAKKLPSGSWRCQVYDYTDETGQKHYKSFSAETKKEAEYLAASYKVKRTKSTYSVSLTFGQAANKYLRDRRHVISPGTYREYNRMINAERMVRIHNTRLDKINDSFMQTQIEAWSAELAPKTVRNYNAFVSGVMAAVYGYVPYSVILPPKEPVDYYIPSDEEVNQTLQAAKGTDLYLPILLAAFGPMRRGEICALTRKNIDFSTGVVHVQYSYSYTEDNTWVIKRTKTYDSDRYISFPGFVIDAIRLRGKDNVTRFLPNQLTQNFEDLLLRAGIPHYRFHDLRHPYVKLTTKKFATFFENFRATA